MASGQVTFPTLLDPSVLPSSSPCLARHFTATPTNVSLSPMRLPSSTRAPATVSEPGCVQHTETTTTTMTTTPTAFGVQVQTVTHTVTTFGNVEPDNETGTENARDVAQCETDKEVAHPSNSTIPTVRNRLPFVPGKDVYVVTRAQLPGIYKDWHAVLAVTKGVKNPIFEARADFADAKEVYTIAYEEGTISAQPIPGGVYDTGSYVDEPIELEDILVSSLRGLTFRQYYVPRPTDLLTCNLVRPNSHKFYLVTKGEAVGVYGNWHQAAVRTEHVKSRGSRFRKCHTWREALIAYTIAFENNEIEVFPIAGGIFDTPISQETPEQLFC
ncbi:hypothetical protein GALMADRAFT_232959 [Galerina marginata CBS 339.88]|uniref:Ribonuclease H1 N-terminal domain-containing protein n=1 Tax=Galerina marginata (strain CBS 339.88) TaxID=685588 RepID=A0A067S600_GALM3|nr:hypothetical protein GALMADRAFT_232959 [Galerina marginata CBS 339.88]